MIHIIDNCICLEKKLSCQHLGGNINHLRLPIGTPLTAGDLHPTNHSPRAVRHPWGKCPNDLGGCSVFAPCQTKNADVPQKWEKATKKNKLATLFPSCFEMSLELAET